MGWPPTWPSTRSTVGLRPLPSRPPAVDLTLLDKDEALPVLPALFDRQRLARAGEVNRSPAYWTQLLTDRPHHRGELSARFHAVCDEGYVLYRAARRDECLPRRPGQDRRRGAPGLRPPRSKPRCGASCSTSISSVGSPFKRCPVDEPIRWRLADPRQLRTNNIEDRLYLRILDTAAAFEARGYRAEGGLVFDVVPPAVPEGDVDAAPGRWALETGADGACCRRARAGEQTDIRLDLPALGSLYMGGFPASLLAAGGRIEELRTGGLARADTLFFTRPSPRSGTGF